MFGSSALEVAIGISFLFFVMSILLTSAREILEGILQSRAIHLERGVRELLKDDDGTALAKMVYEHPMISSLYRGNYDPGQLTPRKLGKDEWKRAPFRSNLPAYIPARNFAVALLDLSARGPVNGSASGGAVTMQGIRDGIDTHIHHPAVRRAILIAIENAHGDLQQARANLEAWFDSSMDRVSGWYRKETQWILVTMGLVAAVVLNVDTIHVAKRLYVNDAMRSAIVAEAEATVERARTDIQIGAPPSDQAGMLRIIGCGPELDAAPSARQDISCAQRRIGELGYAIGWGERRIIAPWQYPSLRDWWKASDFPWRSIPGWLLTAFAISLGAPFWFDLLNKMMIIRSTVKPHEKSPEEASEDRQHPGNAPVAATTTRPSAEGMPEGHDSALSGETGGTSEPVAGPEDEPDHCIAGHRITEEEVTEDEELPAASGGVADADGGRI